MSKDRRKIFKRKNFPGGYCKRILCKVSRSDVKFLKKFFKKKRKDLRKILRRKFEKKYRNQNVGMKFQGEGKKGKERERERFLK